MTTGHDQAGGLTPAGLGIGRNWGWLVFLGAALIVAGCVAISYPVLATLTTVEVFGYLLIAAGVVGVVSVFWTEGWGGRFLHLFGGLVYLFMGTVIVERPGLGAAGYTLMLAVFFVVTGLFRVAFAVTNRFTGWGWALASGLITFALGVMIWRQLPASALWVIGTFIGVELIFNGVSLVMLGLTLRAGRAGLRAATGNPRHQVGV
jgi:uncharacterized membrane protein HdeD (DUF308 family)